MPGYGLVDPAIGCILQCLAHGVLPTIWIQEGT